MYSTSREEGKSSYTLISQKSDFIRLDGLGSEMQNEDDRDEQVLFSMHVEGSVEVRLPVPNFLEPFARSSECINRAIEYYLLPRFSSMHRLHTAFMVNAFWAAEYLMLSILCHKYKDANELGIDHEFHRITKYWETCKSLVDPGLVKPMSAFDAYIGKVQGYVSERHPRKRTGVDVRHQGKQPSFTMADGSRQKFSRAMHMSLSELDKFANFMIHDVVAYDQDPSIALTEYLSSHKCTETYQEDNNYSIIHPNKKYHGELSQS